MFPDFIRDLIKFYNDQHMHRQDEADEQAALKREVKFYVDKVVILI